VDGAEDVLARGEWLNELIMGRPRHRHSRISGRRRRAVACGREDLLEGRDVVRTARTPHDGLSIAHLAARDLDALRFAAATPATVRSSGGFRHR
jgi:hypothetical protein